MAEPRFDLARGQSAFLDVLANGPAALPQGLFAGDRARVLAGLAVHANTVSHARLVALEESFPRTRRRMGDAAFNRASQLYIKRAEVRSRPLADIGRKFANSLGDADAATVDLARIEWAWLEAYHAAEAAALLLADVAALDEATLLTLPIAPHPAARLMPVSAPLAEELDELGQHRDCAAVLVTRPDAEVRLHALGSARGAIFARIEGAAMMGNLLALACETTSEVAALADMLALVETGALRRA